MRISDWSSDVCSSDLYQCHAEKRGPMLFEHAPVRDSCLNCHTPHGSNQHALLVAPIPLLCQQCHSHVRHPNDLHVGSSLANGMADGKSVGAGKRASVIVDFGGLRIIKKKKNNK